MLTKARNICMLVFANLLLAGVLVGAFLNLPWKILLLMAWLSLGLFGRRSLLETFSKTVANVLKAFRGQNARGNKPDGTPKG